MKYPIGIQNFEIPLFFQSGCLTIEGYDKEFNTYQLGFPYNEVEYTTSDGRIDLLMNTKDYIYIFEFKINKSADEALKQIEDKQYAKPFEADGRKIYKIGINFSTVTRRINDWKII